MTKTCGGRRRPCKKPFIPFRQRNDPIRFRGHMTHDQIPVAKSDTCFISKVKMLPRDNPRSRPKRSWYRQRIQNNININHNIYVLLLEKTAQPPEQRRTPKSRPYLSFSKSRMRNPVIEPEKRLVSSACSVRLSTHTSYSPLRASPFAIRQAARSVPPLLVISPEKNRSSSVPLLLSLLLFYIFYANFRFPFHL